MSALDATGMALVVKATPQKPAAGAANSILVQFWVNPRDITLTPDGERWSVRLSAALVELDKLGKSLKGVTSKLSFDVKPGARERFLSSGLHFNQVLPIVPNAERIRAVVRDEPSGTIGSVTISLDRVLPGNGR